MSVSSFASAKTAVLPRDSSLDSTLKLLDEGYAFIANRCRALHSDVFQTRLMGKRVICMQGPEAAVLFYDEAHFQRQGAVPRRVVTSLFGKGGVQGLDGEEHRRRKSLFLSILSPAALQQLADATTEQWQRALSRWQRQDRVVLFDEVAQLLARAVCGWAGAPLTDEEAPARTADFLNMVDAFGGVGPRLWRGKLARMRAERWAAQLVEEVRAGRGAAPESSPLFQIAHSRNERGVLLPSKVAAVELVNVLRPTVAITWYVVFAAHALLQQPHCLERLRSDGDAFEPGKYAHWFAQEVKRYYPFTPFVGAKVKESFEWHGIHFERGQLVLLDVYGGLHDPRKWHKPHVFDPLRFETKELTAFDFIPQGGGSPLGHRCAGEWLTLQLLELSLRFLSRAMTYQVAPDQDLEFPLSRMPTKPRSGFVVQQVRPRT